MRLSVQISDSATPPPVVNRPTTSQEARPTSMRSPTSRPSKAPAAPSPTMTSFRPGSKFRPSTISNCSRSAKPAASTPRRGTLASVPAPIFLRSMITKSSGETSGPSGPRATPGASQSTWMSWWFRMLSDAPVAPLRSTTATSSRACPVTTARNPAAIDRTATMTPTTPAMPKIATTETARRSQIVSRL